MIQIFGRKKCSSTRSAERYFKERGVKFQSIDIDEKAPSPGELDAIAKAIGSYDQLLDKESKSWTNRGLAWQDEAPRDLLLGDSGLYKTPMVRRGRSASVGNDQRAWAKILSDEKENI